MSLKKKSNHGTFYGMLLSLLVSLLMLAALSVTVSAISYSTKDPMSLVKPLSVIAIILSAALSSFISARKFGVGAASISALVFTLIMLTVGIISSGAEVKLGALINYLCYIATAMLFTYLASRKPKRRRHR